MRYILWSLLIVYGLCMAHMVGYCILNKELLNFKKDYKHYKIATFFGLIFYLITSPYWVYFMTTYNLKRKKRVS